jgi:Flp pilus assembly CpaE family ATPase/tetratricopeptide (TPR) repeat protein
MSASERVTVGVLATTPAVCSDLQVCLRQLPVQVVLDERVTRPDPMLLSRLQGLHPELVLVEQPADRSSIQALLRTVAKAAPASAVVMVNATADPEAILEAVRSGARDYLYAPFSQPLSQLITRLQAARPKVETSARRSARGRVIGFLSAKGGCGATTVALHAAVAMTRESGQPTGLADFDLSCGMLKFLTNGRGQYTVLDAATNAGRLDESFWSALVAECSGIEVLSAPAPLAAKQYPETAQFGAVLDFMRSRYAWSLVDLGRGIHAFPASLLEHFDEIYVVTTPDRLALAQAKRVADSLRYGCSFRTVRLVVNRSPAAATVEIERLTGLDVYATLVDAERDLHDALADTRMISEKVQLSRQMGTFARRMAGLAIDTQAPETANGLMGGFRKLIGRVRQATQGRSEGAATPDSAWEALSASAETAFKNGLYDLAANHLSQAVEEARSFGDGDSRYGRSLNRLGVVQCHQGKHAEAERSLKTAAKALERVLGEADPSVLEVLSNLAGVYKATRQHETARQLYESVLKTAESALGPSHTMVAWTLDGLGDVHLAQNEPTAALYAYRRALSIKEQTLGPNDWDVAITLDKISEFYHTMGRYNEAEPLLWRSIEIRTAVLGRGTSALAQHFISLGTLYAAQRRYPEAERVLRYGIAIAPTEDRAEEMLPSLHKLAEVCEGQARFGEAESIRGIARRIVSNGADYAKVLASEFGASAAMVPNAPQGLRAGWAQTSF